MTKEQALNAVEKAIDLAFEKGKELSIHSVIARLFTELNLKHDKGEGEIVLMYQDNTIFVLDGNLKILEKITLNEQQRENDRIM